MKKLPMLLLFTPFLIASKCNDVEYIEKTIQGDLTNNGLQDKVRIEYYPSGYGYLKIYTALNNRNGGHYAPQLVMKVFSKDILSRLREEPPKNLEIRCVDSDKFPDLKFEFWSLAGSGDYETFYAKGDGRGRFTEFRMLDDK